MKTNFKKRKVAVCLGYALGITRVAYSQSDAIRVQGNTENDPCITPAEYNWIEKECNKNAAALGLDKTAGKSSSTTLFDWPLQTKAGFSDCGYYVILNYVDQDNTSAFKDWHCGSVTYNGHLGTDIGLEPYPFYKMDHDQVEVIAAATGTIVAKADGNADKNCVIGGNSTANSIIVQHADGSRALYWHMKKNSLTAKTVGQAVNVGEFLGRVGSSGASNTPHLHFEVWASNTFSSRQDPFAGPCNSLNANSWWNNQKPYTEPAIIKLQINNTAPLLPACPATETPNEDSCFAPGSSPRFYTWIRNDTNGRVASMRIINPNGSTFSSWTKTSATNWNLVGYYTNQTMPAAAGTYTFEATYNNITCAKTFTINCGMNIATPSDELVWQLFPNPAVDKVTVTTMNTGTNCKVTLKNILGEQLFVRALEEVNGALQVEIPLENYEKAIYFVEFDWGNKKIIKKLVRE